MNMVLHQKWLEWNGMKNYFKVVRDANGEKIKKREIPGYQMSRL